MTTRPGASATIVLSLILLLVAAPNSRSLNTIVGTSVPDFRVQDQYERVWTRTKFTGKPTLFVLCDRDAYDHVENWTEPLVESYRSKIYFVPVADLRSVPGFLKGYIRGRFQGEFTYSVLMDWDGSLVEPLNIRPGLPTLVLTDASGTITYRAWGKGSESQVKRMKEKIAEVSGI
jgi:hypothetical protein